eukprot:4828014-Alexandrium_andersonii.AAC.1
MIDGLKTILRRAESRSMRPSGKGTETRAQSEHPWQRDRRERELQEAERPSAASRVRFSVQADQGILKGPKGARTAQPVNQNKLNQQGTPPQAQPKKAKVDEQPWGRNAF